jgi:hypothetical protein
MVNVFIKIFKDLGLIYSRSLDLIRHNEQN